MRLGVYLFWSGLRFVHNYFAVSGIICIFANEIIKSVTIMNSTSIGTYSAEILQGLAAMATDEEALARVAKYVRKVRKEQEKDSTLMSEEEFLARVEKGSQEIRDGKGLEMLPNESLSDFLLRVG